MAKISVMTLFFGRLLKDGRLTDLDMLRKLEEAEFDGVELPLDRLRDDPARKKAYVDYLAQSKLQVTCVDAISDLATPDRAARDAAIETLRAGIRLAADLKCPLVLSAGSRLSAELSPDAGRRNIADALRACMPQARDAGVTLAIEDFGIEPKLQCAAADCLEVIEAAPGAAFVFDTGNFYFAGDDPRAAFKTLAPHTRHVHLKDWVKSDRPILADVAGALLGEGFIPNETLVRQFLGIGVESFSLEVSAPGDPMDAALHDIKTVRAWLAET